MALPASPPAAPPSPPLRRPRKPPPAVHSQHDAPLPPPTPWLGSLLNTLTPLLPPPPPLAPTRTALHLIRMAHASHGDAHDLVVADAARAEAAPELLALLQVAAAPVDVVAALVAVHALSSELPFRDALLRGRAVHLIAGLAATPQRPNTPQREGARLGGASPAAQLVVAAPGEETEEPPARRAVWEAAVRTLAKLMVCCVGACAVSIESGALALLAQAAKPTQPMDIRLRAAAGLAAIAAWSGPRRAVDIVETEGVVLSMSAILTEVDERVPGDLRNATIDGLVVMSFRRHARRVLHKFGCEEKIREAARYATVSGDYAAAARGTVAAGQLTGRSVDEYGFLVEDESSCVERKGSSVSAGSEGKLTLPDRDDNPTSTGLRHLQQQLLDEPYTSVEDLYVLEEIVGEDAGVLSSSPRDRNYIRNAARTYGVSADEIEFISLLEDDGAAFGLHDTGRRTVSAPTAASATTSPFALEKLSIRSLEFAPGDDAKPLSPVSDDSSAVASGLVDGPVDLATPSQARAGGLSSKMPTSSAMVVSPTTPSEQSSRPPSGSQVALSTPTRETRSGSSPQRQSQPLSMEDPDFDRALIGEGDGRTPTDISTGAAGLDKVSPLLMFLSATKRAAEKDSNNTRLQKTHSELNRETENERLWREIIENRPEMLQRERGKTSRVVAYRDLALVPVPPPFRRKLWPLLLDTVALREQKPGLYHKLCEEGESETLPDDIEHTIEADVTRTMPLHSLFWAGGAQVGLQSLRSILRAYARYVPEVGYCQGMSSIAAVLIMNAEDEEEAFLMLAQFMSRFQYKRVFARGFPLMLQWIAELKLLVAHYMPALSKHLEDENVELDYYADKWLITALSHNFPHRYLLRVWDLMFLGGSPKIILKACLAVLKRCEPKLMTMDFELLMPFLQRGFAEPEAGVLDAKDPEPFITLMRDFRFLPDIKKTVVKISSAPSQTTPPATRSSRRDGRGSCFPCFKRSPVVE